MSDAHDSPKKSATAKELKYVKARLEGLNKARAAKKAGYTDSMSRKVGAKIEKPHVRALLQSALAGKHRKIARVLDQAMDADTVIVDKQGGVHSFPDHRTRVMAATSAARLANMEPETKNTPPQQLTQVNVFELPADERRAMIRSLMAELGVDPKQLVTTIDGTRG